MSQTQEKPASEAKLTEEAMFAHATAARSVKGNIENKTGRTMTYSRTHLSHGTMDDQPSREIPPGGTGSFLAQSSGFMTGTEGWVYYNLDGAEGQVAMYFNNPFGGGNAYQIIVPNSPTSSWGGGGGNNATVTYIVR